MRTCRIIAVAALAAVAVAAALTPTGVAGAAVPDKPKPPVKLGKPANFYCRFHVGSGMQGALFSKAGSASGTKQRPESRYDSDGGYGY